MSKLSKVLNYETISYVVIGFLTTAVDYLAFALINEGLKAQGVLARNTEVMIATLASWLLAVLFAYLTNKLIVFRNYRFAPVYLLREFAGFFAARLVSGLITFFLMWLMTDRLAWNEYLAKILTSVFNMVFNYVASKLWIFKKSS